MARDDKPGYNKNKSCQYMADPEAKDQYHNHKKGTTEIFDGKYESPDDDVLIFFIKLSQQWKGI